MRAPVILFTALLSVLLPASLQPETSAAADQIAFANAVKNPDPQKRLDALKAFLAKYPKSSRADRAEDLVLGIMTKNFPDRATEIKRQADLMIKKTDKDDRLWEYRSVAATLADSGTLLPFAEKLESKAGKALTFKSYEASIRKSYKSAKLPAPSDAELGKYFKQSQSMFRATMGSIKFKEGETSEARELLRQAYSDNPDNSSAAALLGMMAANDGQTNEALRYLTRARLTSTLENDQEIKLESLYRTLPSSASLLLDKYLDSQYHAIFPPPFEASKYKPDHKLPGRVVLAELFTGSGCPPCVGADLALEGNLERYSRNQLVLLAFDVHIPRPDPLTTPAGVSRFKFYEGKYVPTLVVDGKAEQRMVGGDRHNAREQYEKNNKLFEEHLQAVPEATVQLSAQGDADCIHVHASASEIPSSFKAPRLQIALVENQIRYSGENGIRFHPMVVRSMAGEDGFALPGGKAASFDYAFDLPKISSELKTYLDAYEKSNDRFGPITFVQKMNAIDPNDLSVVAFVQDAATKHVLQSAYAPVVSAP